MQITHPPSLPSNQKFGWFFIGLFAFIATYLLWRGSTTLAWILYSFSFTLLIFTLLFPEQLLPLNKLWFWLGISLGKIISPIVLGIMFFLLITPVALVTRVFGRDELKLKKSTLNTYWINRTPVGPTKDSFKNQF
jgi:hypothetical protein